jgi:hypothetical protein
MALNFPNSPTDGQIYTDTPSGNRWVWDSANTVWKSTSTFTQTITVASTAPGSPVIGQLWWNQDYGRLLVYYSDGTSSQWVDASPSDYTSSLAYVNSNAAFGKANTALQNTSGTFAGTLSVTGNVGISTSTSNYKLDINAGSQGTTANSQVLLQRFYTASSNSGGNSNYLELTDTRVVAGSSWNGCGARLQHKVDADYQAYIQFNGGNDYGISFGTGASSTSPTGVTERMRIDSGGRITKPYQPRFGGYRTAGVVSSGNTYIANVADINVGSCYNTTTGIFTAPVAGDYFIGIFGLSNDSSSAAFQVLKNNSLVTGFWPYQSSTVGNGANPCGFGLVSLAANDTLKINVAAGNIIGDTNYHNRITIYLLG